jgi:hypothetical protein
MDLSQLDKNLTKQMSKAIAQAIVDVIVNSDPYEAEPAMGINSYREDDNTPPATSGYIDVLETSYFADAITILFPNTTYEGAWKEGMVAVRGSIVSHNGCDYVYISEAWRNDEEPGKSANWAKIINKRNMEEVKNENIQ